MKPAQKRDEIDERRRRLYDRGTAASASDRHELTDNKVDVANNWDVNKKSDPQPSATDQHSESTAATASVEPEKQKPKRRYRTFILVGSLSIFLLVAVFSSLYLYFGGNQVSSDNISIAIQGPSSISGGEEVTLKVNVENLNTVMMESATLILKYPNGVRSTGDSPRNLYEQRIDLDDIAPGEEVGKEVSVAIFGEENEEKEVKVIVEYRVENSNGTFSKESQPIAIRITSSPVVLRIENLEKVASGQLINVTMTAVSNAATPLTDILVTAAYPSGFSFETSDPAPVFGQNVWRIDKINPEEEISIELQGVLTGLTEETFRINFALGPAESSNSNVIGAKLSESRADFLIERPFIDVAVKINGVEEDRETILAQGENASVLVEIFNTLDESVYDMAVEVVPQGNVLDEESIVSNSGFYDSNRGSVRWEVSNNKDFDQVLPGDSRSLSFSVEPGDQTTTASFDLVVNVYARRVAEESALETLIGTKRAEAKYSSSVALGSQVVLKSGPVPPKVGEFTTYTVTVVAEAGANDMANAIVDTSLPVYSNWEDSFTADGEVTYNSVSKKVQWIIGDISSGDRKTFSFDVSIQPSISQVNSAPTLIRTQNLRANDRFTSALLQDSAAAVTTELSTEMGFEEKNGIVEQ